MEESPKQSSGSNGVVERAVQEVEGQIRALLIAMEAREGEEMKPTEPRRTLQEAKLAPKGTLSSHGGAGAARRPQP